MSDGEQMEREARFCLLFEVAYPALRRYATNRGLRGDDADDLVASTLEIAWSRLDDVPGVEPVPWLLGVARNLMRNRWRTDARRAQIAAVSLRPVEASGSAEAEVVGPAAIMQALDQLEPDDQEILRLVAWDDLTPSQAAAVLGCSSLAARTRLHRARNRLAAELGFDPRVQREAVSGQIPVDRDDQSTQTEVS